MSMFCTGCGCELPEGTEFCTSCGLKQEHLAEAVTADDSMENIEGGSGTQKTAVFCTHCGGQLDPGTLYCTSCGAKQEEEAKDEKRKKINFFGKSTYAVMGIAGIFLVAVLVAGGIFYNQPKRRIMRSFVNMSNDISSVESGISKELGWKKIRNQIVNGKTSQSLGVKLSPDEDYDFPGIIEFKMDINSDGKKEKKAVAVTGLLEDEVVGEIRLYSDKDKTVAGCTELYDDYFRVDHKDLGDRFLDSDLYNMLNQEYYLSLREDDFDFMEKREPVDLWDAYVEKSKENWSVLLDHSDIKKTASRTFKIGGKSKKCSGFELTVQKKDLKKVIGDIEKTLKDNEGMMETVNLISLYANGSYGTSFFDILDEYVIDSIDEEVKVKLYIGPKNRIVYMEGECTIEVDYEDTDFVWELGFLGEANPLDLIDGTLQVDSESDGGEIKITRELENKGGQLNDSLALGVYSDYSDMIFTFTTDFNKKSGEWGLRAEIDEDSDIEYMEVGGSIKNIKKGKSFLATLDRFEMDIYGDSFTLPVQLSYGAGPLKGGIKDPSAGTETVDLLELDQRELEDIAEEIYASLGILLMKSGVDDNM